MADRTKGSKTPLGLLLDKSPFTSKWLAEQLGFSEAGWWQIRSGRWRLSDKTCTALAMLLGCSRKDLRDVADRSLRKRAPKKKEPRP